MRARQARLHALTLVVGLLSTLSALGDDVPRKAASPIKLPPRPRAEAPTTPPPPASTPIVAATPAEVGREIMATEARLKALESPEEKVKPATKPLMELFHARHTLLDEWKLASKARDDAERPARSPEAEAAELKAELEKVHALLDQATRSPDALLPEAFRAIEKEIEKEKEKDKAGEARRPEGRLAELKEAIDSARVELKDQSAKLEALRAEGSRALTAAIAAARLDRDKVFQGLAALNAQRAERRSSLASTAPGEALDLAREKLANLDWQARVELEKLAAIEAKIALDTRRIDLGTLQIQVRTARVQLDRRLAERMEGRYDALAERERVALEQAGTNEKKKAAESLDPLERRRAERKGQLLELESQVVAYEKVYATTSGASIQEQISLKDKTVTDFEELKKLLDDGSVSPLDALRLKNDFRRIGPERAQVVRTDLAGAEAELTTYENALTDAEIDLVNDSRDDRFDRESLLEQLPASRRGEANAMLEELEARHKALLNRRRNVLQSLARRAEEAHSCILQRIKTLDDQYAFIRTHIFWIRDAEPMNATTLAHARDDSVRTAKALVHLAMEAGDRPLWSRPSPAFVLALVALAVLPGPLYLGRRRLDRLRLQG